MVACKCTKCVSAYMLGCTTRSQKYWSNCCSYHARGLGTAFCGSSVRVWYCISGVNWISEILATTIFVNWGKKRFSSHSDTCFLPFPLHSPIPCPSSFLLPSLPLVSSSPSLVLLPLLLPPFKSLLLFSLSFPFLSPFPPSPEAGAPFSLLLFAPSFRVLASFYFSLPPLRPKIIEATISFSPFSHCRMRAIPTPDGQRQQAEDQLRDAAKREGELREEVGKLCKMMTERGWGDHTSQTSSTHPLKPTNPPSVSPFLHWLLFALAVSPPLTQRAARCLRDVGSG